MKVAIIVSHNEKLDEYIFFALILLVRSELACSYPIKLHYTLQ